MEILSDTVFRGANVTLSGGTLVINDGTSTNRIVLETSPYDDMGFLYFEKGNQCYLALKTNGNIDSSGHLYGSVVSADQMYVYCDLIARSNLSVSGDLNISGSANLNNGLTTPCASFNGYADFNGIVGFKDTVKVYKNTIELANSEGVSSTVSLVASYSPSKFRCGLILDDTKGCGCLEIGSIRITKCFCSDDLVFSNKYSSVNAYLNLGPTCGCASGVILTSANYSNHIKEFTNLLKHESIYIDFDVPADCTIFSLTTKDKFYHDDLFSATMMKYDSELKFDNETLMAWKPVDVDVLVACQAIGKILVRKSSSFAMNSSDGYTLNLVYTV